MSVSSGPYKPSRFGTLATLLLTVSPEARSVTSAFDVYLLSEWENGYSHLHDAVREPFLQGREEGEHHRKGGVPAPLPRPIKVSQGEQGLGTSCQWLWAQHCEATRAAEEGAEKSKAAEQLRADEAPPGSSRHVIESVQDRSWQPCGPPPCGGRIMALNNKVFFYFRLK